VEADFPHTGPLLTRKLNNDLIAEHYDDMLRLAASPKFGHATASLLVGKLSASGRQTRWPQRSKEYGALRRTIYAARYLADPAYRRKDSLVLQGRYDAALLAGDGGYVERDGYWWRVDPTHRFADAAGFRQRHCCVDGKGTRLTTVVP